MIIFYVTDRSLPSSFLIMAFASQTDTLLQKRRALPASMPP